MPVKRASYKGFEIRAGAFEVVARGRFFSTVMVTRDGAKPPGDAKLLDPTSPTADGLFASLEEALDSAIAFGKAVIDGRVPGQTVDNL